MFRWLCLVFSLQMASHRRKVWRALCKVELMEASFRRKMPKLHLNRMCQQNTNTNWSHAFLNSLLIFLDLYVVYRPWDRGRGGAREWALQRAWYELSGLEISTTKWIIWDPTFFRRILLSWPNLRAHGPAWIGLDPWDLTCFARDGRERRLRFLLPRFRWKLDDQGLPNSD